MSNANKRWATAREIHLEVLPHIAYASPPTTASVLAKLARRGLVQRRLSKRTLPIYRNRKTVADVWEYYVPDARYYFSHKKGRGYDVEPRNVTTVSNP